MGPLFLCPNLGSAIRLVHYTEQSLRRTMRTALAVVTLSLAAVVGGFPQSKPSQSSYDQQAGVPQAKTYSPELMKDVAALRDAALGDDYAYKQVAYLSDSIGPRMTGWPQTEAAVRYVADELRKLGLEVHLEEVHVPRWTRGAESAELLEYPGHVAGATQKIVV